MKPIPLSDDLYNITLVAAQQNNSEPPASIDERRISQAICSLEIGSHACDPTKSAYGSALSQFFSQSVPKYNKLFNGYYAFTWKEQPYELQCSDGTCRVLIEPKVKDENIGLFEIIGAILSGPTGCSVDDPRPLTEPVLTYADSLIFGKKADVVASELNCFALPSTQGTIPTSVELAGIYSFNQNTPFQLLLGSNPNFSSIISFFAADRHDEFSLKLNYGAYEAPYATADKYTMGMWNMGVVLISDKYINEQYGVDFSVNRCNYVVWDDSKYWWYNSQSYERTIVSTDLVRKSILLFLFYEEKKCWAVYEAKCPDANCDYTNLPKSSCK
jgi:hypothetical protein